MSRRMGMQTFKLKTDRSSK